LVAISSEPETRNEEMTKKERVTKPARATLETGLAYQSTYWRAYYAKAACISISKIGWQRISLRNVFILTSLLVFDK
jgi:hypothetical protein